MSKLLIVLLVFFSLLLAGVGYVAVVLKEDTGSFTIPFQNSPTPTVTPLHTLTLSPHQLTVIKGQTNTIDIILDTQNSTQLQPQLIQMEIAYDPDALIDVDITPGGFFTSPTVSLKTINTNTGRISYALEAQATQAADPKDMLNNPVASITFLPNPAYPGRETSLSFLGKTIMRALSNEALITATYGTKLFFASGSAIQN